MKKKRVLAAALALTVIAAGVLILIVWLAGGGLEKDLVPVFSQSRAEWQEVRGPLIETRWKQDGPYAAYTPGNDLLGCWSVAFAQVLAYHRLQPAGHVTYRTSSGTQVDEDFKGAVDWSRLVPAIGAETPKESALETARYCYRAATVVQKDFGRGEYKDVTRVPAEVSQHYGCRVERVEKFSADLIRSELRKSRPLVAYFDNILSIPIVRNGHAAVIDGAAEASGRLMVHVNFGWEGKSDGWYDFADLSSERELLYVFRIAP